MILRVVVPVCNSTSNGKVFPFLHILVNMFCPLNFSILLILIGVRWNLRIIFIFLMTKDIEHFYELLVHSKFLCWEFCLALYPIFKLGYLVFWSLTSWWTIKGPSYTTPGHKPNGYYIIPKRYLHIHFYCYSTHSSQKCYLNMSIKGWVGN